MTFGDMRKFAERYGPVKGFSNKAEVTALKNGDIDTVKFWEEDALQFEFEGKSYSRKEFETLVASKLSS